MNNKMKVLFVSGELIGADLCSRLKQEECDVRLYIEDESRRDCLDGMVEKTADWKKELNWVGKDGLIVFDDVGYGRMQDELRKEGYLVVGGSNDGDKLEKNRGYAQKVFASCGINSLETIDFCGIPSAIKHIRRNKGAWVIKQNGHSSAFTYVGQCEDGSDVIGVLESYRRHVMNKDISVISLQKKVEGLEIGVARYFNGQDWTGPIEINIEHKHLFNNGIGPMTGEMGTLMWFDDNEDNKLFKQTLSKLKPYLQESGFKGNIDINCIVNRNRIYPIEATARFGCPSTQLHAGMFLSPWKDLLLALARGDKHEVQYRKDYGIVVSVSIPPFPYKSISSEYYLKEVDILFKERLTEGELNRLHFEEVSLKRSNGKNNYCIAGSNGFILYVTGSGQTVQEAREAAYSLIDKIVIPKMFYRNDIGMGFIERERWPPKIGQSYKV